MLVPFKETYVRYEEGDLIGWLCAILSLSPLYAAMFYLTLILLRRDIQTIFMLVGQCMCIVIAAIMKDTIAQPRPDFQTDLTDYGMPSSHTLFTFYIGIFIILEICSVSSSKLHILYKVIYGSAVAIATIGVGFARVYLKYHSIEQVIVGALVGGSIGTLWYQLMNADFMKQLFDRLCQTSWFQFLLIRNYSTIEYASLEEYQHLYHITMSSGSGRSKSNGSNVEGSTITTIVTADSSRWKSKKKKKTK